MLITLIYFMFFDIGSNALKTYSPPKIYSYKILLYLKNLQLTNHNKCGINNTYKVHIHSKT